MLIYNVNAMINLNCKCLYVTSNATAKNPINHFFKAKFSKLTILAFVFLLNIRKGKMTGNK